jgi:hypothetical protein
MGPHGHRGGHCNEGIGHSSVQMHKRYVDLQATDVAKAFGTGLVFDKRIDKQNRTARRK